VQSGAEFLAGGSISISISSSARDAQRQAPANGAQRPAR
jgi:hypothetical protein